MLLRLAARIDPPPPAGVFLFGTGTPLSGTNATATYTSTTKES